MTWSLPSPEIRCDSKVVKAGEELVVDTGKLIYTCPRRQCRVNFFADVVRMRPSPTAGHVVAFDDAVQFTVDKFGDVRVSFF